jgi:hypothetical protein
MANLKNTTKVTKALSGTTGELEWEFSDGVLSISANRCCCNCGEIPDYDDSPIEENSTDKVRSPWYSFQKNITKIVFKGYITKRNLDTFAGCKNLKSISFEAKDGALAILDMATYGYTDGTLWSIHSWFCEQIPRMLQDFKRKTIAHPGNMTWEEWKSILDRMIFCFTKIDKFDLDYNQTEEELEACREVMIKLKNEAFELLNKYFWNLWW